MKNEEKALTFHNENAISRIALWANIIAYTLLVFSLIGFVYQANELTKNWSQVSQMFSQDPFQVIAIFANQVLKDPLVGVFYFLVLRGLSQLLNLGLDLYYGDEDEEMVVVETTD